MEANLRFRIRYSDRSRWRKEVYYTKTKSIPHYRKYKQSSIQTAPCSCTTQVLIRDNEIQLSEGKLTLQYAYITT